MSLILYVLGVVLLGLAAFKTPEPTRFSFGFAGLFVLALTYFLVKRGVLS